VVFLREERGKKRENREEERRDRERELCMGERSYVKCVYEWHSVYTFP
jgi:hypothetical protein